jgi:NTP pyrophosphatase (non-canonical NTP hydrolase)
MASWASALYPMPKRNSANVYQFPLPLDEGQTDGLPLPIVLHPAEISLTRSPPVGDTVISGTFRKDPEGLKLAFQELQDLGFRVLSPTNVDIVSEVDGFVYMHGEQSKAPLEIESRHLEAIQDAQFVWLHAPGGYVGLSAALEVGFANASGVPVFCASQVSDPILQAFVRTVASARNLRGTVVANQLPPPTPATRAFQKYYRRVALQRGYEKEGARDTLLLMVEEVGELARAIRKSERIARHGRRIENDERSELADVFIYVVHLANVLGFDLGKAVRDKELVNIEKIAAKKR